MASFTVYISWQYNLACLKWRQGYNCSSAALQRTLLIENGLTMLVLVLVCYAASVSGSVASRNKFWSNCYLGMLSAMSSRKTHTN
jgi:hypothetical protein